MRAVFLDRDGVICENRPDHVKSWSEFTFLPQVKESLARLARLELPIVVVTNQAAINRGIVLAETVETIHRRMMKEINEAGGRIDQVYYCPHRPDERCACRKPQPGLLERAAAEMDIELKGSYFVGDAWTDIQAGLARDCTCFLVLTGRGLTQASDALRYGSGRFQIVRDLADAATTILQAEGYAAHETVLSQPDRCSLKAEASSGCGSLGR